jgi:hypothetical protein
VSSNLDVAQCCPNHCPSPEPVFLRNMSPQNQSAAAERAALQRALELE